MLTGKHLTFYLVSLVHDTTWVSVVLISKHTSKELDCDLLDVVVFN